MVKDMCLWNLRAGVKHESISRPFCFYTGGESPIPFLNKPETRDRTPEIGANPSLGGGLYEVHCHWLIT